MQQRVTDRVFVHDLDLETTSSVVPERESGSEMAAWSASVDEFGDVVGDGFVIVGGSSCDVGDFRTQRPKSHTFGLGLSYRLILTGVVPEMPKTVQVLVPSLPEVPSDEDEAVKLLARTIRECFDAHFPNTKQVWPIRRYRIDSKTRSLLLKGAERMRELGVCPAVWTVFAIELWNRYRPTWAKDQIPPLRWMLTPTRIEKYYKWAAKEWDYKLSTNPINNPYNEEITNRRRSFVGDIRWFTEADKINSDPKLALEIYAKHFPKDRMELLNRRANAFVAETEELLFKSIKAGAWIWGSVAQLNWEKEGDSAASK